MNRDELAELLVLKMRTQNSFIDACYDAIDNNPDSDMEDMEAQISFAIAKIQAYEEIINLIHREEK